MADSDAMWFRVVLLIGLLSGATAARAHEWVDYFATDDATLSPRGYAMGRDVARYWRMDPDNSFVTIDSHMDAEEASRPGNRADRKRARALMLELLRQGVAPGRFRVNLHAADHLARPSYVAEPLNRRAVVNVVRDPSAPFPLDHSDQPYFFFDSGSAAVNEDHRFAVQFAMAMMTGCEVTGALLVAVADRAGSAQSNLRLSAARGEAIARLFAQEGVPWDGIEIEVRGEAGLARPTADGVAEPLNRRVDARIFRDCAL